MACPAAPPPLQSGDNLKELATVFGIGLIELVVLAAVGLGVLVAVVVLIVKGMDKK